MTVAHKQLDLAGRAAPGRRRVPGALSRLRDYRAPWTIRPNRAKHRQRQPTRVAESPCRMAHPDRQHGSHAWRALVPRSRRRWRRGAHPRSSRRRRHAPADQLLSAMRTVKAARFNAAERLERKTPLSLFAMSMVSLYFVGLSVWQAVYALDARRADQPADHAGLDHVVDLHAGAGADRVHERLPHEGAPHARLRAGRERPLSRVQAGAARRRQPGAGVPQRYNEVVRGCPSTTRASTT